MLKEKPNTSVLKVAVVEDSFSHKDFKGRDNIEYNITPYTTPDEFHEAINKIKPDVVILGEPYIGLTRELDGCLVLLLSDGTNTLEYVHKYRKAIAAGAKGVIQKPVSYEGIAAAIKGDRPKDPRENSVIYIDEARDLKLSAAVKAERISPHLTAPTVEEIRKEVRPVILRRADEKTKVVTFYNSKGGVGKTLYSINTAAYLARMYPSKKIAVVDFDLDFGDVANFLGLEPRITALSWQYIPDDTLNSADVENYLLKHPSGVYVLPAPIPPIDEEIFTYKIAHRILAALRKRFDVIIVDLGPTLRDVSVVTIEHADTVYLVSTTDTKSLRKVYDLVRIFNGLKLDREKIKLILTAIEENIDLNELKRYVPYEVILKVPYIKQVKALDRDQALAFGNKRFKLYIEDLSYHILGKKPEKKPFWFLRR